MARNWYAYLGEGNPTSVSSYGKMSLLPGCLNGNSICAINATGTSEMPDSPLSANIKQYVINSLGTLIAQPQDGGRAKKYVYMKPTS